MTNSDDTARGNAGASPEAYRATFEAETLRVAEEVLAPRRLDRRKVLLIGGGGYIGTVLTSHLLAARCDVVSLDCMIYRNQAATVPFMGQNGFKFIYGDLTEGESVVGATDGVSDVVILGGLVGDPITKKYPAVARQINLEGIERVFAELHGRGLNRVVFISTCSNYGRIGDNDKADESHPLTPLSLYAEAKVASEETILSAASAVDYQPVILRFATAFGLSPRMRFDLTVSEFTREMFLGRDLLVYDPDTWRPYCHVRDFADVIHRVLTAPAVLVAGEVFNAGGDINNFTKRQLVDALREFFPDAPVRFQEHGGDPRNYRVNFAKIRKTLGFEPSFAVRDGIVELVEALRQRLFDTVDDMPEAFGNYAIHYRNGA